MLKILTDNPDGTIHIDQLDNDTAIFVTAGKRVVGMIVCRINKKDAQVWTVCVGSGVCIFGEHDTRHQCAEAAIRAGHDLCVDITI